MAVFTRINGDALGARNVDGGRIIGANTNPINTGIAAPLTAYKVTFAAGTAGNLAAELTTGGAVETVLRIVQGNATILAYQVDAGTSGATQLSILAERSGWSSDTVIQNALRQTVAGDGSGNIGALSNVYAVTATISSSGGIKLA
jgi:hypothetical protein